VMRTHHGSCRSLISKDRLRDCVHCPQARRSYC
jgi:hypothetical protein